MWAKPSSLAQASSLRPTNSAGEPIIGAIETREAELLLELEAESKFGVRNWTAQQQEEDSLDVEEGSAIKDLETFHIHPSNRSKRQLACSLLAPSLDREGRGGSPPKGGWGGKTPQRALQREKGSKGENPQR